MLKGPKRSFVAWNNEQKMFHTEKKCSKWNKKCLQTFVPNRTKNVPKGKGNVREQNLFHMVLYFLWSCMALLMAFNGKILIMVIDPNSFGRVLDKNEDLNSL